MSESLQNIGKRVLRRTVVKSKLLYKYEDKNEILVRPIALLFDYKSLKSNNKISKY